MMSNLIMAIQTKGRSGMKFRFWLWVRTEVRETDYPKNDNSKDLKNYNSELIGL